MMAISNPERFLAPQMFFYNIVSICDSSVSQVFEQWCISQCNSKYVVFFALTVVFIILCFVFCNSYLRKVLYLLCCNYCFVFCVL